VQIDVTTFTADQLALRDWVVEQNRKTQAWIDAAPGRGAGLRMEDLTVLASWGIFSIDDAIKYDLCNDVYYATKDKYGYKPYWSDLKSMTIAELKQEADRLNVGDLPWA
jgi:hypothetical protein